MNVKNLMSRLAFWKRKRPIPVGDAPTEKHISGLTIAISGGNPASRAIDFNAGEATIDIKHTIRLKAALTKNITEAWAEGNNNGGLLNDTWKRNAWYHCFVILSKSGTVDAGFSTALMPHLPKGYSFSRRVGSFKTVDTPAGYPLPFYAIEYAGGNRAAGYTTNC
jgi:hypothetical protein